MLLAFAQWIQLTGFFTYVRSSTFFYPIVLSLHMCGIAMFGGMILAGDLRMLGVGMTRYKISDFLDQLRTPKRYGLLLMVTMGAILAGSKAEEYYYNAFFRTKMILLLCVALHALVFRKVYANAAALDQAKVIPGQAKAAAVISLLLWSGLVVAGRGIGYIEPPLDLLHAKAEQGTSYYFR
jgi:hypothetical protein